MRDQFRRRVWSAQGHRAIRSLEICAEFNKADPDSPPADSHMENHAMLQTIDKRPQMWEFSSPSRWPTLRVVQLPSTATLAFKLLGVNIYGPPSHGDRLPLAFHVIVRRDLPDSCA